MIDRLDRKILQILQEDATVPVAEIGRRVGLSTTPCWRRIQKLEEEGVITGRVALVDPDKIGLGITVFVSVETGDHSEDWLEQFADTIRAMPEVMEFYRMAGDVDYMLSGGLNAGNVSAALEITGATAIDVSSGVESAPGVKDSALISRFFEKVAAVSQPVA